MDNSDIAEVAMMVFGMILIIDSLILHLITFNYTAIGLGLLDPWFDHWMLGLLFVIVGGYLLSR